MKSNIEEFDELTGEIFAHLYLNFPVPMLFDHARWNCEIDEDYFDDPNSTKSRQDQRKRDIIDGTFRFLEKSGYVNYVPANGAYLNVNLTEKALLSLKKHPDSLKSNTFGDVIADALESGAKEKMSSAVGAVMSQAFASITGWNGL